MSWTALPQRKRRTRRFGEEEKRKKDENKTKIKKYEYLDHTADVQVHAWGASMEEAFENVAIGMFGYMTDMDKVEIQEGCVQEIQVEGHDKESLLYNYLSEWLFVFSTKDFIACSIEFVEFDMETLRIHAVG